MWYEFLIPKRKTVIATLITSFLWIALLNMLYGGIQCAQCIFNPDFICGQQWPQIIHTCTCCFTATDFFNQLFGFIIIPFVIIYLFYSSLFYKLDKKTLNETKKI